MHSDVCTNSQHVGQWTDIVPAVVQMQAASSSVSQVYSFALQVSSRIVSPRKYSMPMVGLVCWEAGYATRY